MKYGFKCPCHGVQICETQSQRDAFAITYQCRLEMFRVEPAPLIDTRLISRADQLAALARMTETEIADTLAAIHQSYTTELQGTQA
jgi:hypothetical protein